MGDEAVLVGSCEIGEDADVAKEVSKSAKRRLRRLKLRAAIKAECTASERESAAHLLGGSPAGSNQCDNHDNTALDSHGIQCYRDGVRVIVDKQVAIANSEPARHTPSRYSVVLAPTAGNVMASNSKQSDVSRPRALDMCGDLQDMVVRFGPAIRSPPGLGRGPQPFLSQVWSPPTSPLAASQTVAGGRGGGGGAVISTISSSPCETGSRGRVRMAPLTKLVVGPVQSVPSTRSPLPGSPANVSVPGLVSQAIVQMGENHRSPTSPQHIAVPRLCCLQSCMAAATQQPSSAANYSRAALTVIPQQSGVTLAQQPHSTMCPASHQSIPASTVGPGAHALRSCLGGGGLPSSPCGGAAAKQMRTLSSAWYLD